MSLGIIEINDAGVQVAVDEKIALTSPGYAVLDGDTLLIGNDGMENARLLPRWSNNRFWNQLSTDPVPNRTATVRHHADLAFAHLESLWNAIRDQTDQVIFIVPGFYSREQLGLLLGMAQECDMPVAGVVDAALASVCRQPLTPTVLHLDIFLHRITLTTMSVDNRLARLETMTVSETGIFTLWDRWANIIANQFIQTSRYDPMHQAASEQQLFNRLPGWIRHLDHNRGNTFELELGDVSHSVSVSNEQLTKACANIYPQIVQAIRSKVPAGETARLYISHRFEGFPGLENSLELLDNVEHSCLDAEQPIKGAVEQANNIISSSGSVSHVVSLPINDIRQIKTRPSQPATRATHMLLGNHARAIGTSFRLSADLDDGIIENPDNPICTIYPRGGEVIAEIHDTNRVKVNGNTPDRRTTLMPGDRLSIDNAEITMISVGNGS